MLAQYFWDQPMFVLILLTGVYFRARKQKVFSQNLHNESDFGFFINRCDSHMRCQMIKSFLGDLPGGACFLSFSILWIAIRLGGAGALLWFAVFTAFTKGAAGASSALFSYYFAKSPNTDPAMTPGAALRRKRFAGARAITFALILLESVMLIACLHPHVLFADEAGVVSVSFRVFACIVGAALLLLCVFYRFPAAGLILPSAFCVFVVCAIFFNGRDLMLAANIIITDAVQLNRSVFIYSGMGWTRMLGAGALLCASSFLMQTYFPRADHDCKFPHVMYEAVYAQLRSTFMCILQFLMGMLILCFELEPIGNRPIQQILYCFVGALSLFQIYAVLRRLKRSLYSRPVAVVCALAVWFVTWRIWPSAAGQHDVIIVVTAFAFIAQILSVFSDSGWYFALMEDYRDRFVWHSAPHPNLSGHFTDE